MHRVWVAAVLIAAGCSTTHVVSGNHAAALRQGGHRDAFNADDTRIGPESKLRFCRVDGCSDWIWATDLRVDDEVAWVDRTAGYAWSEVESIDVKGMDGIKTTGAIIGITAAIAVLIPIAILAASAKATPRDGTPTHSASGGAIRSVGNGASKALAVAGAIAEVAIEAETEAATEPVVAPVPAPATAGSSRSWYWGATLRGGGATSANAKRLFTTGARVRSKITLGAHVDTTVAHAKDLVTGGAVARLRLGNFVELGAGARLAQTKGMDGAWDTARMYVVQGGFHSPVTARFAVPLGVDVSWGKGDLEREVRIPWGVRYTSPSGRFSGTLQPVTPSYARRADADKGRWSIAFGLELGVTL